MEKVTIEPFKVIGITVRTTNQNGQGVQDIGVLWQRFVAEQIFHKIPNKIDEEVYLDLHQLRGRPYPALYYFAWLQSCPPGRSTRRNDGMVFEGGSYKKMLSKGDLTKGVVGRTG